MPEGFVSKLNDFRDYVKENETLVRDLQFELLGTHVNSEVMANLTLAIRHLEDARMRLGKAIQYSGDGVSIYDKENE